MGIGEKGVSRWLAAHAALAMLFEPTASSLPGRFRLPCTEAVMREASRPSSPDSIDIVAQSREMSNPLARPPTFGCVSHFWMMQARLPLLPPLPWGRPLYSDADPRQGATRRVAGLGEMPPCKRLPRILKRTLDLPGSSVASWKVTGGIDSRFSPCYNLTIPPQLASLQQERGLRPFIAAPNRPGRMARRKEEPCHAHRAGLQHAAADRRSRESGRHRPGPIRTKEWRQTDESRRAQARLFPDL